MSWHSSCQRKKRQLSALIYAINYISPLRGYSSELEQYSAFKKAKPSGNRHNWNWAEGSLEQSTWKGNGGTSTMEERPIHKQQGWKHMNPERHLKYFPTCQKTLSPGMFISKHLKWPAWRPEQWKALSRHFQMSWLEQPYICWLIIEIIYIQDKWEDDSKP